MEFENEDIANAIRELDKSLGCLKFDIPTTGLLEQTNHNLNQIAKSLNEISNSLNQLTIDLGSK